MLTLYHGSGASVTKVLEAALPEDEWATVRNSVQKLLIARGYRTSAAHLDTYPFELRNGTNDFADEFCVLYARVSLAQYTELGEIQNDLKAKGAFRFMAETVSELGHYARFVVVELNIEDTCAPVSAPSPANTSQAVEGALLDAEALLRSRSASSALDRVHTALHAYLEELLDQQCVSRAPDASITELWKQLQNEHPKFVSTGPRREDILKIGRAMANVCDALNPIRNQASRAHPNPRVLAHPEAMLVINAARTLLHYLEWKLQDEEPS